MYSYGTGKKKFFSLASISPSFTDTFLSASLSVLLPTKKLQIFLLFFSKAKLTQFSTLLKDQYRVNNGQSNPDNINSPRGVVESAIDEYVAESLEELDTREIVHESMVGWDDMTKRMEYTVKQKEEEQAIIKEISDIKIVINKSKILSIMLLGRKSEIQGKIVI